jgi:hypothetical protein
MAYGLADAPPDAVAEHRLPERARRREANVRTVRLRFAHAESRKERAGVLDAAIVDPAEILGTQQTDTFRKTSDRTLPLGADGQFLAAASAAAGQDGAAVFRLHTGAEAVCFRAVAVVGLEGAFRHDDYK